MQAKRGKQVAQAGERIVGVVGLGIMGGAIARHLAAAGWRTLGFDIAPAAREAAARAGVLVHDSLATLAAEAPILLTSLPHPAALAETAERIAACRDGRRRVLVECSTFALADKEAARKILAAAGHVLLDCPISGTGAQAQAKDVVVYASGERAEIARLDPLFSAFAREWHDVGAFGNGSRMKFVANLLVAIHNVAAAEAMVLARKAGLDPEQTVRLIGAGAGGSRVFSLRAPMMAARSYSPPTMRVSTWAKDMAIIDRFLRDLGVVSPLFDATQPIYAAALAQGHGEEDTAAVHAVLERASGLGDDAATPTPRA
ncbi:MAG: NAD(P)-dependent oxidoreductase [Rhodovarius sp.]|nr:NAD(P)-dependent oxidoreductase [Rhodovarius sp.]MDW8313867.1 NAD(P)-dependent oxidoreductase [Rhodovarius sp.]